MTVTWKITTPTGEVHKFSSAAKAAQWLVDRKVLSVPRRFINSPDNPLPYMWGANGRKPFQIAADRGYYTVEALEN